MFVARFMVVVVLVAMLVLMTMTMTMMMHSMIPRASLNRLSIFIRQHISSLQKIIDNQDTPGPQPLLELLRSIYYVFEVVEPEAYSCEVKVTELWCVQRGGVEVGFVEEVADRGGDGEGLGEGGGEARGVS